MRTKTSQKKPVLIIWIIMTPIRVLGKAKKFYVKGITNFSTSYNRPTMIVEAANRTTMQLPRSFSTNMLPDDHGRSQPSGGLPRASSASVTQVSMADIERYMIQKQIQQLRSSECKKDVPRNCSVGMGRIDENRVSSFRDDTFLFENRPIFHDNSSRLSRNLSYTGDSRRF